MTDTRQDVLTLNSIFENLKSYSANKSAKLLNTIYRDTEKLKRQRALLRFRKIATKEETLKDIGITLAQSISLKDDDKVIDINKSCDISISLIDNFVLSEAQKSAKTLPTLSAKELLPPLPDNSTVAVTPPTTVTVNKKKKTLLIPYKELDEIKVNLFETEFSQFATDEPEEPDDELELEGIVKTDKSDEALKLKEKQEGLINDYIDEQFRHAILKLVTACRPFFDSGKMRFDFSIPELTSSNKHKPAAAASINSTPPKPITQHDYKNIQSCKKQLKRKHSIFKNFAVEDEKDKYKNNLRLLKNDLSVVDGRYLMVVIQRIARNPAWESQVKKFGVLGGKLVNTESGNFRAPHGVAQIASLKIGNNFNSDIRFMDNICDVRKLKISINSNRRKKYTKIFYQIIKDIMNNKKPGERAKHIALLEKFELKLEKVALQQNNNSAENNELDAMQEIKQMKCL